mgnify:CR=1 FL=1
MNRYTDMTGLERYDAVNSMASDFFETARWKVMFAERYGVTRAGVQQWKSIGAPEWACVALDDALSAKRLDRIAQLMAEHINR